MSVNQEHEKSVIRNYRCYCIMGDPIALARPRHGNNRTWDPQKQLKVITHIGIEGQHNEEPLFTGPLQLNITFFMPIPKMSKKKMDEWNGQYHHKRPDFSNMLKYYEDVATGICYGDDCIISVVYGRKIYDYEPRVEFTLVPLG